MKEREKELVAAIELLKDRCAKQEITIQDLRDDLRAVRARSEAKTEELERLKRRLQALGSEPGGEG